MRAPGRRKYWLWPFVGIAFLGLGTWAVMFLWNNIVVDVVPQIKELNYWKALGLLILCKILFGHGGPRGGWRKNHHNGGGRRHFREKWRNMSAADRDKMKEEWRKKCEKWNE